MERAQELGVTRMVFLGDIVGYNADPGALVDRIGELVANGQAQAVLGNHDQAVYEDHSQQMQPDAWAAIEWTRTQLNSSQVGFLKQLPLICNEDEACYVHASAYQPVRWHYVTDDARAWQCAEHSQTTYTFVGHVHDPMLFYQTEIGKLRRFAPYAGKDVPMSRMRRWVSVVGSLGQPRDGKPEACFAVFEPDAETTTFHRVPYDFFTASDKVRRAGLPESLANRLITGQ